MRHLLQYFLALALTGSAVHASSNDEEKLKIYLKPSTKEAPKAKQTEPEVIHKEKISSVPVEEPAAEPPPTPAPPKPTTVKKANPAPPAPAPAASEKTFKPVPPEQSLTWLKNGNTRYVKGFLRSDGLKSKDRMALVGGQQPHAIVVSCSDSRVPPELLFDQKLGEIFVVRTAGQILDLNSLGSIEYAVLHLGSRLIVVMGHESCGAVKAALLTMGGADAGSPALNALVHDIQPRIREFASKPQSPGLVTESWANVKGVAQDLIERSQIIRDRVAKGELQIHTALYHLGSGQAEFNPAMNPSVPQ